MPLFAMNHVGIKAARALRVKRAKPRNGFPAQRVNIGVVSNLKRNILSALRKHDAPPRTQVQKWKGIGRSMPYFLHYTGPDCRSIVFAGKSEPALDFRMQASEVLAQNMFIDRFHLDSPLGLRRQRDADGRSTAAK